MKIGKVSNELLEEIVFKHIKNKREEVLIRAGIGEDTAVVDFKDELCVISTDPITGATENLGALAVHISCNDVATRGAEPIALLMTILLPENSSANELDSIMKQASEAAKAVNVEIVGGHTEVTDAVNRVVLSTTVLGRLNRTKLSPYTDIDIGDKVVLTKSLGIEGTHILANECFDFLKSKMNLNSLAKAKDIGINLSVVKEGLIAQDYGVKYMHDITEGGVYGAVWEAAKAVGKGIELIEESLPVEAETIELCNALNIDYRRLISSGSMLMITPSNKLGSLIQALNAEGIKATEVGTIIDNGVFENSKGVLKEINSPGSDELYKALKLK